MRGRLLGRGSRSPLAVPKQRTTCPLKGASTARKHGTDQWERSLSVHNASPRWRCLLWRQIRFRLASYNWLAPSDGRTAALSLTAPQRARATIPCLPPPFRAGDRAWLLVYCGGRRELITSLPKDHCSGEG
ncbi:hypothetical protein MTO96_017836 [Rhipicephalus appendiculatus]